MDQVNIGKDELTLLAYLHEHCKGFSHTYKIRPDEVRSAISMSEADFRKASTFLTGFDLIGVDEKGVFSGQKRSVLIGVWLTSRGENFMRQLEADLAAELAKVPESKPGMALKITTAVAGGLWDVSNKVIASVLATYVNRATGMTP